MENFGDLKDPLALDAITERRLVAAFLEFLKAKAQKPETSAAARESLGVARECLSQAFELSEERVQMLQPSIPLLDIFGTHPEAAPANPKAVLEAELKHTPQASAENKAKAEEFKNKGNDFMKSNQIDSALQAYTDAIALDPTNPILYCNRAAAYSKKEQHDLAAKDCEIALAFDNNYAKAYGRYGLALHGLGLFKEAKEALEKAVSLDPENQLYKNNLQTIEDSINAHGGDQGAAGQMPGGFPGMPGGFPGMSGGLPGMQGMPGMQDALFGMLQNQDFQQTMMNMMQNPQVQQLVGQFSSMFMNQMGGAPGAPGAPPGGQIPPNMEEMLRNSMGNLTPEQIAEQMRGLFGGAPPGTIPNPPNRRPDDKDKDKENQGPGTGGGGSYFS